MSRIFMSHSGRDKREAVALRQWLSEQRPELANEIFLDIDPQTGLRPGQRWKAALRRQGERCEVVICLLSRNWEDSPYCQAEYLTSENLGKKILVARLEDLGDTSITSEWQRCDLFAAGAKTEIPVTGGPPVRFNAAALDRLRKEIEGSGVGPENFVWPPGEHPRRAPYRGWEAFEDADAGVFFGRDVAIVRGLDALRAMRASGTESLFVVLGPSGSGKSSFLRAGLIPRIERDDRHFLTLGIMRPERNALSGTHGFAAAIDTARRAQKLRGVSLGDIKKACRDADYDRLYHLLMELRAAAGERLKQLAASGDAVSAPSERSAEDAAAGEPAAAASPGPSAPTLVLPLDQAEELFSAEAVSASAADEAEQFLKLLGALLRRINADELRLIVAASIRTDCYEAMQDHSALDGIGTALFNKLKTMPLHEYPVVIKGPAARASEAGNPLTIADELVDRLIADAGEGADTLPLLALTLRRLYTDYASTGEITVADYDDMGGMPEVVNNVIEEVLSEDSHDRDTALHILRLAFIPGLATINPDNDQPMRRVALESELPEKSRPLIDAFVEKRLLVRDERGGQVVVEVALESLLRQWDELAEWLWEERQSMLIAADLERAAIAWDKNDRDDAWLLQGRRLAEAEAVAAKPGFVKALGAAYLAASREHGLEAERQRLRDAVARRLVDEARAMLARTIPGGDIRAFQELVAAQALAAEPDEGAILDALIARPSMLKIIDAGASVTGVAFSPDGQRIVTRCDDKTLRRWDAHTGQPLGDPLTGHTDWVMAVSPDEQVIVSGGGGNKTLRLWDTRTGQPIGDPLTGHTGAVSSVAFSPDGRRLVTASWDTTVRLWDAHTGQPIGDPLTGHTGSVTEVAFSPDGQRIVSGSTDKTLRQWDAHTGQPIGDPLTGHTGSVTEVAFSSDGRCLASTSDSSVWLWDTRTGQPIGNPLTGHTSPVSSVALSPDGHTVASGSRDTTVRLWDAHTGQPLGDPLTGHTDWVNSVAFSPDGHTVASGSRDTTVRLWDAHTGQPLGDPLTGRAGAVNSVAFSPDGRCLASGSVDGTVRLWDAHTGQPLGDSLTGHTDIVYSVAFSPDGQNVASGSRDATVRLWDAHTGQPLGDPLTGHTSEVNSVAFSPDGRRLASASVDGTVRLWDAHTGQPLGDPLTGHPSAVNSVAFSPDGRRLVTASWDKTIRLWDAHTGQPIGDPLAGHTSPVNSVAFSPDGQRIVSGSNDKSLRLWDADTGQPIGGPLTGHTSPVDSVSFSPDGQRIASGSWDNTVRLWDTDTGQPIGAPLTGHRGSVLSVAYSPDGRRLASGSDDHTVRMWPGAGSPDMLCRKLTANISRKQWREWVSPNIDYIPACPGLPIPSNDDS